jgi:glycosyltransferase involved in cell wall biosynthesis
MRLAFYAPLKPPNHPVASGDRRMARLLVQAWESAGHELELASSLCTRDGGGDPARQAELAGLAAVETERLKADYANRPAAERPAAWFTYHVYYKAPDWIGPGVAEALQIPYLIAEASLAGKRATGPYALGHRGALAAVRAADAIFVINPADREALEPQLASQTRLIDLPAFLDTARYRSTAGERDRLRREIARARGLDPGGPWLLSVAMMREGDKLTSYRLLGEALMQIADLPWQLIVIGDGPARDAVSAALASLGESRVRFLGALPPDELAAYYAAADLCLWPAVNEAYGMALLEAQSAGLPVVAGAEGGVPSIVEAGTTGLLTPLRDSAAFAAAVRQLILAPDRRAAMARSALTRTRQHHDIAGATRILDDTLQRIFGSAAAGVRL